MRRVWWLFWVTLGLLVFYHTPWYVHESAGFTMHGYDLAEWTSLHPAVRSSSPVLLTSLLLRIPLLVVVAALALIANRFDDPRWRWIVRAGALVVALRFVPPMEFFTGSGDDPNYRQMLLLTLLSLVAVVVALAASRLAHRVQDALLGLTLVAGLLAGWWGLSRSEELLDNFAIDVQLGGGIIGFTVFACIGLLLVWLGDPAAQTARSASYVVEHS